MTVEQIKASEKELASIWYKAWRYAKDYPQSEIAEAVKRLDEIARKDADAAIALTYKIGNMLTQTQQTQSI